MSHHQHDDLRDEIRDTRDRMSETLDQLGTRLNPNRIKAQVRENIREATVGRVENMARHASERVNETREGIMDTIRDNPIPAAMIGIGLGWMLFNGRRGGSHSHAHDLQPGQLRGSTGSGIGYYGDVSATTPRLAQDDAAGGIGASISHWDEPGASGIVGDARERLSNATDTAREKIGDVAEGAQELISDVSHGVRDVASDVADTTRWQAHRLEDRVSRTMHDNPLALGAVALAVGVAAGLAIPETRREHRLMGGARDQLMERARDAAEETRDKVQNVAERVIDESRDTAREAARDEGLTS